MQVSPQFSAESASIHSRIFLMLDGHTTKEMESIVQYGKKQIDVMAEGRRKGQLALREKAEARRQFIIATASAEKREYPYLTEAGLVAQVEQRLMEQRHRFGFGKGGRLPGAKTIYDILQKAGSFKRP